MHPMERIRLLLHHENDCDFGSGDACVMCVFVYAHACNDGAWVGFCMTFESLSQVRWAFGMLFGDAGKFCQAFRE